MQKNNSLRKIPAIDKLLENAEVKSLIEHTNENLVKHALRKTVDECRQMVKNGQDQLSHEQIMARVEVIVSDIYNPSLRPVLNASGIILHTNLGRAPLGAELLKDVSEVLCGYSNLEFNLTKGARGMRDSHTSSIISYLTGAEDVIVVNNNAAAVLFLLSAFGKRKEVVVSRGELIEIGGAFRIPDIMKASGCKMIEVGATNKTKVSDYEGAISDKTSVLFKAHRSNFSIKGFTEEISIVQLAELGRKYNVMSIYDIGSGLLRKVDSDALRNEPDVKEAIDAGVDVVCFSGDKLLGGGQAGIIAGKKKYIDMLKKHPLLRALRVCKTTIAILETACRYYLDDKKLFNNNILFVTLNKKDSEIENSAKKLQMALAEFGINSHVSPSEGEYGGGTLPDVRLKSYEVRIDMDAKRKKDKTISKTVYNKLLLTDTPLLTNLKNGAIYVDMLCVNDKDIPVIANSIKSVLQ